MLHHALVHSLCISKMAADAWKVSPLIMYRLRPFTHPSHTLSISFASITASSDWRRATLRASLSLATSPRAIPSIPNLTIAIDGAQDASSRRDAPSSILDGEATRAPMFTALTQFFHCTAVHRIPRRLFRRDFRPCTRHFGGIVSGESQIARDSSRCDAIRKMPFRERKKKRPHSLHCP